MTAAAQRVFWLLTDHVAFHEALLQRLEPPYGEQDGHHDPAGETALGVAYATISNGEPVAPQGLESDFVLDVLTAAADEWALRLVRVPADSAGPLPRQQFTPDVTASVPHAAALLTPGHPAVPPQVTALARTIPQREPLAVLVVEVRH